jgi:hypothetical protein
MITCVHYQWSFTIICSRLTNSVETFLSLYALSIILRDCSLSDASERKPGDSIPKRQRTKSTIISKFSDKGHDLQMKVVYKASA